MKKLLISLLILGGLVSSVSARVNFAITQTDGDRKRLEFEKYEPLAELYRQNKITPTLIDYNLFVKPGTNIPVRLAKELKKFHVVQLLVWDEGVYNLTPEKIRQAERIRDVLKEYVQSGGALIIHPCIVRYPGNDDEKYWNIIFEAFGFRMEPEGIADKSMMVQHEFKTGFTAPFYHTKNIKKHEVTEGVRGLWFPVFSYIPVAATPLVTLTDPAWEAVVRGEKTATSWKKKEKSNAIDLNAPGSCKGEPPLCAVRSFGKGRVAVITSNRIWSGQNYGIPSWSHIVETKGLDGKHGDLMKLLVNLVFWGADASKKNPELGTYVPEEYHPVSFPERVQWDNRSFQKDIMDFSKGIIGAHSNFAGGKSTVAEYVAAAKAAGLKFIVFTDPLEKSSEEKLNALKEACRKSSDNDFYACPGVEFTDGSGIRWIFMGEKVIWPKTAPFVKNGFKHVIWDGKVVKNFGHYAMDCSYPASAIINYGDLYRNGVRPENLWWFYNLIPYSYNHGKPIADNYKEWSFALKDLRIVTPVSFTRISDASEVKQAADISVTAIAPEGVRKVLNSRCSIYYIAKPYLPQVSYGKGAPVSIRAFDMINDQQDPRPLFTKGTQRVKGKFSVSSPNGLKEVRLIDAVDGLIRRFDCKGAAEFVRTFELVHDKQHYIWLEAEDMKGCKAVSRFLRLFDYKQGLFRCNDNLNILGPLGYYWHPDRNEMLPLFKTFRNGEFYSVQGWDRGGSDCPVPHGDLLNVAHLEGVGEVLPGGVMQKKHGMRMAVSLGSGDLQVVDAVMDSFVEAYDNQFRPGPSFASPARKISDNPYFTHTQRMYSPRDRMNHHIAWDHRRLRESLERYDGSFLMFEGEITFKQDITFQKTSVLSFELARFRTEPSAAARLQDDVILVTDKEKGLLRIEEKADTKKKSHAGSIAEKGFVALMSSPIGYLAIMPIKGDFRYHYFNPGYLKVALGTPGQSFKKGDKLKYAFISGDFIDKKRDGSKITLAAEILRDNDYPVTVKIGKQNRIPFFFEVEAEKNEAGFNLGPKPGLGIDLPIRVKGLKNNGCIAVYSSLRPWMRFVGTAKDGAVYFQEDIDRENEIWVGNVFLAENDALRLTFVMDGQETGKRPFLEIHNPTQEEIKTEIRSPANTPKFGGTSFKVTVPAGDSIRCDVKGRLIR